MNHAPGAGLITATAQKREHSIAMKSLTVDLAIFGDVTLRIEEVVISIMAGEFTVTQITSNCVLVSTTYLHTKTMLLAVILCIYKV